MPKPKIVPDDPDAPRPNMLPGDVLKDIVNDIERLESERAEINGQLKTVYAEAKAEGYMVKVLRLVIRRRKRALDEVHAEDELVNLYEDQLT